MNRPIKQGGTPLEGSAESRGTFSTSPILVKCVGLGFLRALHAFRKFRGSCMCLTMLISSTGIMLVSSVAKMIWEIGKCDQNWYSGISKQIISSNQGEIGCSKLSKQITSTYPNRNEFSKVSKGKSLSNASLAKKLMLKTLMWNQFKISNQSF